MNTVDSTTAMILEARYDVQEAAGMGVPEMKVLIVDDHPLLVGGLRDVLAGLDDVVEFDEADSGEAALECIARDGSYDYICLDLQLPGLSGLEFLRELQQRRSPTPVVVVSANDSAAVVHEAMKAGAIGYISKGASRAEFEEGFRVLLRNGRFISSDLRKQVESFRAGLGRVRDSSVNLTRRQRQVLSLVAEGKSNAQIGLELGVAESTVKGHVAVLMSLFDAENRTACIREAQRLAIL